VALLTLEQLDQFGSLDDLPFSLDANWVEDGICGPYSIELLDYFGTIDSIEFSLDDEIWTLDTTCITLASAVITASGVVDASAEVFIGIDGAISASGTLSVSADRNPCCRRFNICGRCC
jgi:hypothetical protein